MIAQGNNLDLSAYFSAGKGIVPHPHETGLVSITECTRNKCGERVLTNGFLSCLTCILQIWNH